MNFDLSGKMCCDAYLNDLVIWSNLCEEHVEHRMQVFFCLREAGLTVNLAKCEFCECDGHLLGKRGRGRTGSSSKCKGGKYSKFPRPI